MRKRFGVDFWFCCSALVFSVLSLCFSRANYLEARFHHGRTLGVVQARKGLSLDLARFEAEYEDEPIRRGYVVGFLQINGLQLWKLGNEPERN